MSEHDTRYQFISRAAPTDEPLGVICFSGTESISQPFRFELELKTRSRKVDVDALLSAPCTFVMAVGGRRREINGLLAELDVIGQRSDFVVYKAVLVPRLWQLSLYCTNEVYIDQSVPEIIKTVLEQAGLTQLDFDMRFMREYKTWPFRCQFGESHLQFISRLMEHEGIYYFFEHKDDVDKIIFCDNFNGQDAIENSEIRYAPPTGLDAATFSEAVHSLICRQKRLPRRITLKDYNDENPSVDIKGEAEIDAAGMGSVYDYGSNIETPEEGKVLAQIRAEEIRCRKRIYHGDGMVGQMEPGYTFSLYDHFQDSFNQNYQILELSHEGHQPSLLTGENTETAAYRNSFTAIPAGSQFRPERLAATPRFYGTMNAFVDAEGDGEYAEVDDLGRYKVVLPFDQVNRQGAKASCWVRMSQPYAGVSEGMHFPLRKGTEVLLTFIGGDPDRPVIANAVPNHGHPSVVTDRNQTTNVIQTSSGNRIEIEDRSDANRIKLETGDNKTYMHLGAPNHDGDGWVVMTSGMERKEIKGGQQITIDTSPSSGAATTEYGANVESASLGSGTDIKSSVLLSYPIAVTAIDNAKGTWKYKLKSAANWSNIQTSLSSTSALLLSQDYEIKFTANSGTSGTTTLTYREWNGSVLDDDNGHSQLDASLGTLVDLSNSDLFASGSVSGTDSTEVLDLIDQIDEHDLFTFVKMANDGVDTSSESDRPQEGEAINRDEELTGYYIIERERGPEYSWEEGPDYSYRVGTDLDIVYADNSTTTPSYVNNSGVTYDDLKTALIDDLFSDDPPYAPSNAQAYGSANSKDWSYVINDAHVSLAKHDTITGQKGNIYDFGGYWNYNLGNSYAENHSDQKATLNLRHTTDWPSLSTGAIVASAITGGLGWFMGIIAAAQIGKNMVTTRNVQKSALIASAFALMAIPSIFLRGRLFKPGTRTVPDVDTPDYDHTKGLAAPVKWTAEAVADSLGSDFDSGIDDLIAGADSYTEIKGRNITLDASHAWVEKTFAAKKDSGKGYKGGSYSYTEANAIEINIGDTESHVRGNSHTYTYGGRHEEFDYSDEGVLLRWNSGSLWEETAGFVHEAEVEFERITGQPYHIELSLLNMNVDVTVPSLPQLNIEYDGSFGNTKLFGSLGGNVEIDFGQGNDLQIELASGEVRLETDSEIACFKARIDNYMQTYTEANIKSSLSGLEELQVQVNELTCQVADRMVEIENKFGGMEQEIKTKFASLENSTPPKISRRVGPTIEARILVLRQAGLDISTP